MRVHPTCTDFTKLHAKGLVYTHYYKSCLLCIDGVFVSSHTLVRSTIEVDALLPGWCRVSKGIEQGLYLFLTGLQKKIQWFVQPECLPYLINLCNASLTIRKSDVAKM